MEEKEYHKQRRMFFLINGEIVLPKAGSDKSHFEWLIENGQSQEEAKKIIETKLRGAVNPNGNVQFYIGEEWLINGETEKIFFEILPELVKKLNINPEAKIGGGAIKGEEGEIWPARKNYGQVKDYLK